MTAKARTLEELEADIAALRVRLATVEKVLAGAVAGGLSGRLIEAADLSTGKIGPSATRSMRARVDAAKKGAGDGGA
jgi:hypothetical protein